MRRARRGRVAIRERLRVGARGAGSAARCPSAANFLSSRCRTAAALRRGAAAERGVKRCGRSGRCRGIGDALRIGVGPWDAMERALAALGEVPR